MSNQTLTQTWVVPKEIYKTLEANLVDVPEEDMEFISCGRPLEVLHNYVMVTTQYLTAQSGRIHC